MKIVTNHLACGQEVTIDLEPTATKQVCSCMLRLCNSHLHPRANAACSSGIILSVRLQEIKQKLEAATGVPALHQKVMLSGINQIVMGDKR